MAAEQEEEEEAVAVLVVPPGRRRRKLVQVRGLVSVMHLPSQCAKGHKRWPILKRNSTNDSILPQ